ncbi:MAG: RagB/SusD family nutrient uptake outer membrane protein, partial [Prevotella sp.]|nr:RagB/SusD family nutrient uptake outer membrane protein [Prevotella sp.]
TSGTALALKGRLLLLWASPLFNRAGDSQRWTTAYDEMKADLATIDACGYGLYQTSSNVNGSDFAGIFTQTGKTANREAIFFTLYNTTAILTGIDDAAKNNTWERMIRPDNTGGNGQQPSRMMIDLFPMADGKIPAEAANYTKLEASAIAYDNNYPFISRDPRFYRTFAFPGFRWAYNGDASAHDSHNPSDGANYVLWNYVWYTDVNDQGNPESGNSYGADNLLGSKQGVYVRKKSDDLDANPSPLYAYNAAGWKSGAGPFYSAAPLIELRYAEVLLNLAEAACMAGHMDEAVAQLQAIRARAGYSADNNYGLQANLASDKATCMSAILYERQIEFAYEGKRFDDMRRWLLYDGGTQFSQIDGAPASWSLSGDITNTCAWLGYKPLNGQRRENIEFRVADKYGVGTTQWDGDPLLAAGTTRYAGVDLRKSDLDTQLGELKTWYEDNLVVKERKGDGRDSQHNDLYIQFMPQYYLLGFSSGVQNQNKYLPQTIGWGDYNKAGANGTFDPLAD